MNLVVFDFDGTITSNDTWTPFMRMAARPERMRFRQFLLAPVALAYRARLLSASQGRRTVVRLAFEGEDPNRVRELGAEYAATVLPRTVRPRAMESIERHRSNGDEVVVVSASLGCYLEPWCAAHRLPVICTVLEELNGRLTGRYRDGDCAGLEKPRRLRRRYDLSRYSNIWAYGDSVEDREMLAAADRKFYRWREIADWGEVSAFDHPSWRR
jgi:HAD superfamily hydrolase (TIGR01490 family)